MVRFSRHARERMQERRVTESEVREALGGVLSETPGKTPAERNLWGSTRQGRRLRITVRAGDPTYVITVVALGKEVR